MLGHDAHQNFFHVALGGAKLFKGFCSFITSFVERFPIIEISPIACGFTERVDGGTNGFVSGVVFVPEGFSASAVEGDGGDGGHGLRREQGNNTRKRPRFRGLLQTVTKPTLTVPPLAGDTRLGLSW